MLGYLEEALEIAQRASQDARGFAEKLKAQEEFNRREMHIRSALKAALPGAERRLPAPSVDGNRYWPPVIRTIEQAIYALKEGIEVVRRIGPPPGPQLSASSLHTTVWDAATSLWRSNHRRQAVEAAAVAVNAALQDKLGRRDLSNTALVREAFSKDPPATGRSRLRLWPDDRSETYRNLHDGAREFGAGCFMALRNVVAHEPEDELAPQEALEQLAAFSILARWIEAAEIVVASDNLTPGHVAG